MGAEFVEVDYQEEGTGVGGYAKVMSEGYQKAQREMYFRQAMDVDIIITTALIPGKPAPKLITAGMVENMKPGSVIVDLAAEQGGNCELTVPGEAVVRHGVTIIGYTDLPAAWLNNPASSTPPTCGVCRKNYVRTRTASSTSTWRTKSFAAPPSSRTVPSLGRRRRRRFPPSRKWRWPRLRWRRNPKRKLPDWIKSTLLLVTAGAALFGLGLVAPPAFMSHFTVFILACFVGYMVIWNVTPALHTPLMSVTNAISGIIVIGALLQIAPPEVKDTISGSIADLIVRHEGHEHSIISVVIPVFAGLAILLATINIVGGFMVTQRMLKMFRR